ncbi:hypothetical protein F4819DRAFT_309232 [Hypoxylon fuscum]|nr:hypothetical protein F4819DRAFT_309232 [Hypoxylon fuscum]
MHHNSLTLFFKKKLCSHFLPFLSSLTALCSPTPARSVRGKLPWNAATATPHGTKNVSGAANSAILIFGISICVVRGAVLKRVASRPRFQAGNPKSKCITISQLKKRTYKKIPK